MLCRTLLGNYKISMATKRSIHFWHICVSKWSTYWISGHHGNVLQKTGSKNETAAASLKLWSWCVLWEELDCFENFSSFLLANEIATSESVKVSAMRHVCYLRTSIMECFAPYLETLLWIGRPLKVVCVLHNTCNRSSKSTNSKKLMCTTGEVSGYQNSSMSFIIESNGNGVLMNEGENSIN